MSGCSQEDHQAISRRSANAMAGQIIGELGRLAEDDIVALRGMVGRWTRAAQDQT
jgi:hypothetical protein